jgi:hypothetical protein
MDISILYCIYFTKTQKWIELTALVSWWCFIVLMQNKKSWYKEKIARPDMAPQNFNPRSLTFDHHVLFDVSQVAINNYDCRVSDPRLKFRGAISGWAIFSLYQVFLFCIKTIQHHQLTKAVSSTHFGVCVKISLLFVIFLSPHALPWGRTSYSLTFSYLFWINQPI